MSVNTNPKIVIAGAGSVGCYVGGTLALAGRGVTALMRPALADMIAANGFKIRDLKANERHVAPAQIKLSTGPALAFKNADVILVTVKSLGTREMAELIARHAPSSATVISLQNGVDNARVLRERLGPGCKVFAGMVPFNVMQLHNTGQPPLFLRATSGTIQIEASDAHLSAQLNVPGLPVSQSTNMTNVLWSKLVINLNNAVNALAGIPLRDELHGKRWRLILARQMDEALSVLKGADITPAAIEGVKPALMAKALRLPAPLFRLAASTSLAIDPEARSSMWEDLERRRMTEIDYLQGAILRLAEKHGVATPLTRRIIDLIKTAEKSGLGSPRLDPDDIVTGL